MNNIEFIHANCIAWFKDYAGETPKLIYADPPFNIGVNYSLHNDSMNVLDYLNFIEKWIHATLQIASNYIVICTDPKWTFYYDTDIHQSFLNKAIKYYNWERIVWHRTFGNQSNEKSRLSSTYTSILVYGNGNAPLPDWSKTKIPSKRLLDYNDHRADPNGKIPGMVWEIPDNPESSVWKISQVCGTFKERVGWHPAQQPIELVKRIILALTKPGDLVIDPFGGSGTTAITCAMTGRKCISIDISKRYTEKGKLRLQDYQEKLQGVREKELKLF